MSCDYVKEVIDDERDGTTRSPKTQPPVVAFT